MLECVFSFQISLPLHFKKEAKKEGVRGGVDKGRKRELTYVRLCTVDAGPPHLSYDVDFRFDTFCFWPRCRGGPHIHWETEQHSLSRAWCCFEDHSTMQSTMNLNGLQRQGSQENYILDNSLRKKCSLWSRRSLRGNNDRHQQSSGTLAGAPKVRKWIECCAFIAETCLNLFALWNENVMTLTRSDYSGERFLVFSWQAGHWFTTNCATKAQQLPATSPTILILWVV